MKVKRPEGHLMMDSASMFYHLKLWQSDYSPGLPPELMTSSVEAAMAFATSEF